MALNARAGLRGVKVPVLVPARLRPLRAPLSVRAVIPDAPQRDAVKAAPVPSISVRVSILLWAYTALVVPLLPGLGVPAAWVNGTAIAGGIGSALAAVVAVVEFAMRIKTGPELTYRAVLEVEYAGQTTSVLRGSIVEGAKRNGAVGIIAAVRAELGLAEDQDIKVGVVSLQDGTYELKTVAKPERIYLEAAVLQAEKLKVADA